MATARRRPSIGINLDAANQADIVESLVNGVLSALGADQDQATIQAALDVFKRLAERAAIQNVSISNNLITQGKE